MSEEDKMMDIFKKIEREKALIQAANLMRQQTNNDQVRSKLDNQMREGKRNLEFFEEKLKELQLRRGMGDMSVGGSSTSSRPPGMRSDSDGPPAPPPKDASGMPMSGGDPQYSQIGAGDLMPPRGPFAAPGPGMPKPRPNFTKLGTSHSKPLLPSGNRTMIHVRPAYADIGPRQISSNMIPRISAPASSSCFHRSSLS